MFLSLIQTLDEQLFVSIGWKSYWLVSEWRERNNCFYKYGIKMATLATVDLYCFEKRAKSLDSHKYSWVFFIWVKMCSWQKSLSVREKKLNRSWFLWSISLSLFLFCSFILVLSIWKLFHAHQIDQSTVTRQFLINPFTCLGNRKYYSLAIDQLLMSHLSKLKVDPVTHYLLF